MVLVHHKARKQLFDPRKAKLPVSIDRLTGVRITFLEYTQDGRREFLVDSFCDAGRSDTTKSMAWLGRTLFLLKD